jgi:integrase
MTLHNRRKTAALRFMFVKTLKRAYLLESIPFPKEERRLPIVLSQDEVTRLITASDSLMHRAMLMTLYATGMRPVKEAQSEGKRRYWQLRMVALGRSALSPAGGKSIFH